MRAAWATKTPRVVSSVARLSMASTYHLSDECSHLGETTVLEGVEWSDVARYSLKPCNYCARFGPSPLQLREEGVPEIPERATRSGVWEEYREEQPLGRAGAPTVSQIRVYHLQADCGYVDHEGVQEVPWSEVQRYRMRPCDKCAIGAPRHDEVEVEA